MAKKEDNIQEVNIQEVKEVDNVIDETADNTIVNYIEPHGRVVCVCNGFVIVEDDFGNGLVSYKTDVKLGDII